MYTHTLILYSSFYPRKKRAPSSLFKQGFESPYAEMVSTTPKLRIAGCILAVNPMTHLGPSFFCLWKPFAKHSHLGVGFKGCPQEHDHASKQSHVVCLLSLGAFQFALKLSTVALKLPGFNLLSFAFSCFTQLPKGSRNRRFTFWDLYQKWTKHGKPKGQKVDSLWASER